MSQLFVVSAPSAAGKTTLCRRLLESRPQLAYSVSFTTRPPRPGEEDGRDYFFVDRDRFQRMIEEKAFLEWAEVFGQFYGTGRDWVAGTLAAGQDVLVDIDIAGARQIKANFNDAVFIFIVPPSFEELTRRLRNRSTESEEQVRVRLNRAREEIEARHMYDYLVVNDSIDRALDDLQAVIRAERLRTSRSEPFWADFFTRPAS